LDTTLKYP